MLGFFCFQTCYYRHKVWQTKRNQGAAKIETQIIRVFNNSYVYRVKFKSSSGCYIFIHYNLPLLEGSDTPQGKKANPALILIIMLVLVQNISFKLHLYSKISENFPHLFTFLYLPLSQYVQISPEKKMCRKGTVKPFGSCDQTAGGEWGGVF